MRTLDDIKYEIAFIEQEIVNGDFPYLKQDELQTWLVALRWTLKESERWVSQCVRGAETFTKLRRGADRMIA